ncbi:hypothetical protein PO124_24000 [Bacillus licheniformis]|nr:hypothetical protein [Bacillus licheniformis]
MFNQVIDQLNAMMSRLHSLPPKLNNVQLPIQMHTFRTKVTRMV